MDIPFKLKFRTYTDYTEDKLVPENFAHSVEELQRNNENYSIEVKENYNLSLLFDADYTGKMYIDFLDMYPRDYFMDDEVIDKVPFIRLSKKERILFSHQKKDNTEYPMLIPGYHKVTIIVENKKYYMFLVVTSLHIKENQLENMRNEVDNYLEGLAKKRRGNLTLDNAAFGDVDVHHVISIFIKYHKKIISSLISIKENPKHTIEKKYKESSRTKSGKVDSVSIKKTQRRIENQNNIITYANKINYNIEENMMLKNIINIFKKNTLYCIKYLNESINRIKKEKYNKSLNKQSIQHLKEDRSKLKALQIHMYNYLNIEWNNEVAVSRKIQPRKLTQSRNYNLLFKVYKKIKNKGNETGNPLNKYQYFWKETSKLYEIWGYLKILELIEESKFKLHPIKEKMYTTYLSDYNFPFLDPETRIVYKNDENLKVVVYYDSQILEMSETNNANPIFTIGTHNTPDLRIDIYVNDIFMKTIMGDFKYRSYQSLERLSEYKRNRNIRSVYKQLYEYSQVNSLFVRSATKKGRSDPAVHETWVFYPTPEDIKGHEGHDLETNIRRIELSPNKNHNHLLTHINRVIEEVISEY